MPSLIENNVYSPVIDSVDVNNDVANLELANRTLYLKNSIDNLQSYVNTFKSNNDVDINNLKTALSNLSSIVNTISTSTSQIDLTKIATNLTDITKQISDLQTSLKTHTHNYAASSVPSGDASTVSIVDDSISTLYPVGTSSSTPTKLRRNSNIKIENSSITANEFIGSLTGEAKSALNLSNNPSITLTGEVIGSNKFNGFDNLIITSTLKEQNITPGDYGAVGSYTLSSDGTLTIPTLSVNSSGVITSIKNNSIKLPNNLGINGITSAINTNKKIFLVGVSEQSDKAPTYSQTNSFLYNGKVYSNNSEVVNINDKQNLTNKTYNNYTLNDACSYGVDNTIGGTDKDNTRLVTSNSLFNHTHKYASSDDVNGKATYVKLNSNIGTLNQYLITSDNDLGSLNKDKSTFISNGILTSSSINATSNMYIPGGKIWIEAIEVPTTSDAYEGSADSEATKDGYVKETREIVLQDGLSCKAGTLLSYKAGGYIYADNSSMSTSDNLMLATIDSLYNVVSAMSSGQFNLNDTSHDGEDCYVGVNGQMIFGFPDGDKIYIKKIGYVEGKYLIFSPNKYSITK